MSTASPSISDRVLGSIQANPVLASMLAAGTLGAGVGGVLSAQRPKYSDESPAARRLRILRNMLLLGGASAAGVGGVGAGLRSLYNAVPESAPRSSAEKGFNTALTAGLAGSAGYGAHRAIRKGENISAGIMLNELGERATNQSTSRIAADVAKATENLDAAKATGNTKDIAAASKALQQARAAKPDTGLARRLKLDLGSGQSPRDYLKAVLTRPENATEMGMGTRLRGLMANSPHLDPSDIKALERAGINPAFLTSATPSFTDKAMGALGRPGAKGSVRDIAVGSGKRVFNRGNLLRGGAGLGAALLPEAMSAAYNLATRE